MRFLLDQAVSWRVARDLNDAGYDAVHVREIGLRDAQDDVILKQARDEARVVITQDTDYGTLLAASHAHRPSVILLRMRDGRPETHSSVLLANLPDVEDDLTRGAIVVMGDELVRVRRLPVV